MTNKTFTAEIGTSGNSVTTSDASPNTLSVVSPGSGGSIVYSTTQVMHGHLSVAFTQPTAANSCYIAMDDTSATSFSTRFYLYLTGYPSTEDQFGAGVRSSTDTHIVRMHMTTTGNVRLVGPANYSVSAVALSLNTWYRIAFFGSGLNGSSGSMTYHLYSGDGSTLLDSLSQSGFTTTDSATRIRYGRWSSANQATWYIDDIAQNLGSSTEIGVANLSVEFTDNMSLTDGGTNATLTYQPSDDAVGITDTMSYSMVDYGRVINDSFLISDSLTRQGSTFSRSLADAFNISDGVYGGAIRLSSASTLTADSSVTEIAAATLSSASSLTATGIFIWNADSTLSSASGLTAAGSNTVNAAALLSNTSALTADSIVTEFADAILGSASSLTAPSVVTEIAAGSLASTSSMTVAGLDIVVDSAAFSNTSALTVDGQASTRGAAALTSLASLTAQALNTTVAQVTLTTKATVAEQSSVNQIAAANLTSLSSITVPGVRVVLGLCALETVATLTVSGIATANASAALISHATLTGTAPQHVAVGNATLITVSTLIGSMDRIATGDGTLSSLSALTASGKTFGAHALARGWGVRV